MEDEHLAVADVSTLFGLADHQPQAFFAVFDGHAGSFAYAFDRSRSLDVLVRPLVFASILRAVCRVV
jgi:serine/threonine protein phosphatase PrpC